MKKKCDCCGYYTIEEPYDICPVCFWENDNIAPDEEGGANGISLAEARRNYRMFGACGKKFLKDVRPPLDEEKQGAAITDRELISAAKDAMRYSYSPYSKFRVGAALRCSDGSVFSGCNIENATYGAANCAERTAVFKAVSEGNSDFEAIAIVSSGKDLTFPCGICRQVLAEFAPDIRIILEDKDNNIVTFRLDELLPHSFRL